VRVVLGHQCDQLAGNPLHQHGGAVLGIVQMLEVAGEPVVSCAELCWTGHGGTLEAGASRRRDVLICMQIKTSCSLP